MAFRKFRANQIFTGDNLLHNDEVLITDEDGTIEAIVSLAEAGEDIQQVNGILSPGFVNCHCHLELSHMKGLIPEKTGLIDFVWRVVTERHFAEAEIVTAIENAESEMLSNGIVAIGDICNNLLTLPQKLQGNLFYYNFIEVSGWLPEVAADRFKRSMDLYQQFTSYFPASNIHHSSITPHAPYSVSKALWKLMIPYFKNRVASIHNQETLVENEFFKKGTGDFNRLYTLMNISNPAHQVQGKSSLQCYFDDLLTAKNIILVHNTFSAEEDIVYAQERAALSASELFWCLCINANLYIEEQLPPVNLLVKNKGTIVLGTDSLASNWSLSILDEIKILVKHFPQLALQQLLQWATLNGAKALGIENRFGSFEQGKKPGVILLEQLNRDMLDVNTVTVRRLL